MSGIEHVAPADLPGVVVDPPGDVDTVVSIHPPVEHPPVLQSLRTGNSNSSEGSGKVVARKSKGGPMRRSVSNPSVTNFFSQDPSTDTHLRHDKATHQSLRHLANAPGIENILETAVDKFHNPQVEPGAVDGVLRNLGHVEGERLSVKQANSMYIESNSRKKGGWTSPSHSDGADTHEKKESKRSNSKDHSRVAKEFLSTTDKIHAILVSIVAIGVVIVMCVWAKEGLLGSDHLGHVIETKTREGHMHSPLFTTPVVVALPGTGTQFFEVRLIGMATKDYSVISDSDSHRRLAAQRWSSLDTVLQRPRMLTSQVTGKLTYRLYADGVEFFSKSVDLRESEEVEQFTEVDVGDLGHSGATAFSANVTATMSNGQEAAFMLQVLRMSWSGRYRRVIGIIIFIITFIGIVSEKIHRNYSAFLGASTALCAVAGIQETPGLRTVTGMIDWGTLMLLFSMMILVRMLAITGFFNWCALKVVQLSDQNSKIMYYALTNICGVLSMFLDNVTCVMLFGPLTISLAKKMQMNPRPLYLAMTICATVGGTATFIGDPPNIVIGSKMKIGFEKFLIFNLPIVVTVLLPLSSVILYYRLKDVMYIGSEPAPRLDITALARENRITDMPMLLKLCVVFFAIFLALCLHPVHHVEPAWFTTMACFACALLFEPHKLGKYLEFVEWDTLLFFALLFVLVESLVELGVIRMLGEGIIAFIELFPVDSRMSIGVIVILWVSAVGSAFLESLPYTATIVYILIDLRRQTIEGVRSDALVWPLSVGACVGGIGSIMGSSANLVCIAVSNRYCDTEEYKVQGSDFLKHGLPTMLILVVFAMFWQLFLFVGLEAV